jgi:hypothetical protein
MILMMFPQVGPHFRPPRSPVPASSRAARGEHSQPDRAKYVRNLRLKSTSPAQYADRSGHNGGRQHPASRDQPVREPLRHFSRVERRLLAQIEAPREPMDTRSRVRQGPSSLRGPRPSGAGLHSAERRPVGSRQRPRTPSMHQTPPFTASPPPLSVTPMRRSSLALFSLRLAPMWAFIRCMPPSTRSRSATPQGCWRRSVVGNVLSESGLVDTVMLTTHNHPLVR